MAMLSLAVAGLAHLAAAPRAAAAPGSAAPPPEPPILRRLPPARRGALLRLSMQDHYVEIVTDRGAGLALMRLSDAIAETAPEPGRQVHRSHWVAARAVAGARREGGRPLLRLRDGAEIPVSRSRAPALREAGWL
jgi:DNA-binding LytR/AlgR family response regulator